MLLLSDENSSSQQSFKSDHVADSASNLSSIIRSDLANQHYHTAKMSLTSDNTTRDKSKSIIRSDLEKQSASDNTARLASTSIIHSISSEQSASDTLFDSTDIPHAAARNLSNNTSAFSTRTHNTSATQYASSHKSHSTSVNSYILTEQQLHLLTSYVSELAQGKALSKALNSSFFCDYEFYTNEHVLCPRQVTQALVHEAYSIAKDMYVRSSQYAYSNNADTRSYSQQNKCISDKATLDQQQCVSNNSDHTNHIQHQTDISSHISQDQHLSAKDIHTKSYASDHHNPDKTDTPSHISQEQTCDHTHHNQHQSDLNSSEQAINHTYSRPIRILDLGTGSGCIAISLSKMLAADKIPAEIFAVDVSNKALSVAKYNAKKIADSDFTIHDSWPAQIATYIENIQSQVMQDRSAANGEITDQIILHTISKNMQSTMQNDLKHEVQEQENIDQIIHKHSSINDDSTEQNNPAEMTHKTINSHDSQYDSSNSISTEQSSHASHIDDKHVASNHNQHSASINNPHVTSNPQPHNKLFLLKSNWFSVFQQTSEHTAEPEPIFFDIIISNPPYIAHNEYVHKSAKFDPKLALYAQEQGFANYKIILESAKKYLYEHSKIIFEIPTKFLDKLPPFKAIQISKNISMAVI